MTNSIAPCIKHSLFVITKSSAKLLSNREPFFPRQSNILPTSKVAMNVLEENAKCSKFEPMPLKPFSCLN